MFKESPQPEVTQSFYPNIGQSFLLLLRLTLISIPPVYSLYRCNDFE